MAEAARNLFVFGSDAVERAPGGPAVVIGLGHNLRLGGS
jgi:hypothetical protein